MINVLPIEPALLAKGVREERVLTALIAAAERDAPCPTNNELADLAGCQASDVSEVISRLARRGAIRIGRRHAFRRVWIVRTALATDWSVPWKRMAGVPKVEGVKNDEGGRLTEAEILARRGPNREPCPRCQVRADIHDAHGCGRPMPAWGLSGIGSMGLAHG